MDRWEGKVAVITGASAGIGLAIAKAFVQKGLIVVGLARRKSKMLSEMRSVEGPGKFYAIQCDVTKEPNINAVFEWIKKTLTTIHILINNAGTILQKRIEDCEMEELMFILNVNFTGLLYCSKQAIELMKENGEECHIINMNSIAGLEVTPIPEKHFNIYSPTKFAVRSLTETLAHELSDSKIRICNISPGAVKSEILDYLQDDNPVLNDFPSLEAEDVANTVMHVIGAPPRVQITEVTIRPFGGFL